MSTEDGELPHDVWLVIPARGESKGIPGKNLRLLADRPLIEHMLARFEGWAPPDRLVVTTDDEQIASVARGRATIHPRDPDLAGDRTTLDEVMADVASWLLERGAAESDIVLTLQPTSPFLRQSSIHRAVDLMRNGAATVLTVKDDRHLRWTRDRDGRPKPLFTERVNRQWLPESWAETGGVIASHLGRILATASRIHEPVALLEVDPVEGLDIDDYSDWAVAEYYAARQSIVIRADATPRLGMGHVFRALALAHELASHDVVIATRSDGAHSLGSDYLRRTPYRIEVLEDEESFLAYCRQRSPDITVLDVLDTSEGLVRDVADRSGFVVTFEDLGPGSRLADLVINDLYTDLLPAENHWYGVQHAVLAPAFERVSPREEPRATVDHVLITFGGTDPGGLTLKAIEALAHLRYAGRVTVVLGPGYQGDEPDLTVRGLRGEVLCEVANMAELMREADAALTSGGRTVTELMTVGVPTIVMCQNMREMRHTHASSPFGVMNVGLGELVRVEALASYVKVLMDQPDLRMDMRRRALQAVSERSNSAIAGRILSAASGQSHHHTRYP